MLKIEIVPLNETLLDVSNYLVQILNINQDAFEYEVVDTSFFEDLIEEFKNDSFIHVNSLYPKFEILRNRIGGHHPNLMGLTNVRIANEKFLNLFGDLKKHNGIPAGNGVITTFQVQEIIKEIPIEAYLLYEFIICPILIVTRRDLFHEEKRYCPFDVKESKIVMYEVLKHCSLCIECSRQIKKQLSKQQLDSMRSVFSIIDDLSNNKMVLSELIQKRDDVKSSSEISDTLDLVQKLIAEDRLGEAIDELSEYIEKKKSEFNDEILMLQGQLARLRREQRLNLIDKELLELNINRIRDALLQIINEIKRI